MLEALKNFCAPTDTLYACYVLTQRHLRRTPIATALCAAMNHVPDHPPDERDGAGTEEGPDPRWAEATALFTLARSMASC